MKKEERIYEMLNDPLVQEVLFNIFEGDEKGFEVIDVLLEKGETTEEEIAKEIGVKLNVVRKLLYKLYDARLVDYKRWKDEETNWYSYTWLPTPEKLPYVVKKKLNELIKELEEKKKELQAKLDELHAEYVKENARIKALKEMEE